MQYNYFRSVCIFRLMTSVDIKKSIRKTDFSIDASHELALFLRNNLNEISLINSSHFCFNNGTDCATYITKTNSCVGNITQFDFYYEILIIISL